jgi:cysteine desulfuration protein SufE
MTIDELQDEIIEEFLSFEDWLDKYEYIIGLGKDLKVIDEKYKTSDNLIKGCQSNVWLYATLEGNIIVFSADSDAIITKGIISLLIRVLSNRTPDEIINANLYFIDKIGLKENLSPTRANGLLSMIRQIKLYAIAYREKLKPGK